MSSVSLITHETCVARTGDPLRMPAAASSAAAAAAAASAATSAATSVRRAQI